MKKQKNRYFGEEIIDIVNGIDRIIENFLNFGVTDLIISWIKSIQDWAEKNEDEDLIEVVVSFIKWKDKEELKQLISITKNRHRLYLKFGLIENNVFIAHNDGDPFAKELESFLFKEKFNPIIMQEHPNIGRTIIDKLKSINFNIAIILLTESHKLRSKTKISQTRANVILEAGYCYCYFEDIDSVVILYDGKVEIPSNIAGVEYIKIDENWKYNLINSLKARGLMKS